MITSLEINFSQLHTAIVKATKARQGLSKGTVTLSWIAALMWLLEREAGSMSFGNGRRVFFIRATGGQGTFFFEISGQVNLSLPTLARPGRYNRLQYVLLGLGRTDSLAYVLWYTYRDPRSLLVRLFDVVIIICSGTQNRLDIIWILLLLFLGLFSLMVRRCRHLLLCWILLLKYLSFSCCCRDARRRGCQFRKSQGSSWWRSRLLSTRHLLSRRQ